MNTSASHIPIEVPENSALDESKYLEFLHLSYQLLKSNALYLTEREDERVIELAHLIPDVVETVLAIYIGINDTVCNKGLVCPYLPRHSHNMVFVFDPSVYGGDKDIPEGTVDAKKVINGFLPPNSTWNKNWTYVMIQNNDTSCWDLWQTEGYIDTIPAKFEDFTMISHQRESQVCIFIDEEAFNHPVNILRKYLKDARIRGDRKVSEFTIPKSLENEIEGLQPVILHQGEKLFVARKDFLPCDHCWNNLHPDNKQYAVVNENSAIPLPMVLAKPQVMEPYRSRLIPPSGSADFTTDWFYSGDRLYRKPIKKGHIQG